MLFSSITFLYCFLPVTLLCYFLAPARLKNGVLLLASLLFYGWGEPKYLFLMLAAIILSYGFGLGIEASRGTRRAKLYLILSAVTGLGLLGWYKYAGFFAENLRLPLPQVVLPIGISFYTFQLLSYTVDVYRGEPAQRNLVNFAAYAALFPQLIAGPIVRYTDVAAQLKTRTHSLENTALGTRRFVVGLGKKVLLANNLGLICMTFRNSGGDSVLYTWLYALAFTLQIYFDFSGYSDMAIGLGRIFGFRFPENFDYPYISTSITEFWRRWHMTLGSWFRDYVYIPLGGNRVSKPRWLCNLAIVWLLTGFWHGAAWNFILWGLWFAVLLVGEKLFWGKYLTKVPLLRRVYVLFFVILSFVLFNANSLTGALTDLRHLFGGLPFSSAETRYALRSNAVLLGIAILGATPLPRKLASQLEHRAVATVLEPLLLVALLLLVTAWLVDGSFNPFLYFRF